MGRYGTFRLHVSNGEREHKNESWRGKKMQVRMTSKKRPPSCRITKRAKREWKKCEKKPEFLVRGNKGRKGERERERRQQKNKKHLSCNASFCSPWVIYFISFSHSMSCSFFSCFFPPSADLFIIRNQFCLYNTLYRNAASQRASGRQHGQWKKKTLLR